MPCIVCSDIQNIDTSSSAGLMRSGSSLHPSGIQSRGIRLAETRTSLPLTRSKAQSAKIRPRRKMWGLRTREGSKMISGRMYVLLKTRSDAKIKRLL